ncbi:hypothetical protein NEF87_002305 [Candidatus Lokiarchaeum ossiferum]|uniref:Uncharacterized protein n=1 Tax=Candidatus Lokiarchaeum ossiferum TaxID=2951803 RepID=A0ABY6HR81_9ARCH|nr:hypothetical protein NEF87_002305 [Candidatus Lokiarchaeum sp. B-35]
MKNTPSIDEKEQLFNFLSESTCQNENVYFFDSIFYFTIFPGLEPKRCVQVIQKTVREIRKDGECSVPENLFKFFNAQQRRKRFNLSPGCLIRIDVYSRASLKLIGRFDPTPAIKITTQDLGTYFNTEYLIHFYDPHPMPKDFVHKNAKLENLFTLDNISIGSNISRYQGYQIFNTIKNTELKLYKRDNDYVNLLNWHQTIPQIRNTQTGMRGTTLHLSIGIYKIKIGNREEVEGYLISFNDKGPMVILDGKKVVSSNSSYQLELIKQLHEMETKGSVTEKCIKPKNEEIVPHISSLWFEQDLVPIFTPNLVLHPHDVKANPKKKNNYHSEFKILNNFVSQLGLLEHEDKTEITGELFILSEKTPCYGCLDVLWNQFNELFPNINVKYNFVYGFRASKDGFQKIDPTIENSPIIVPNTQEKRQMGFLRHSEFLLTEIHEADVIVSYLSSFERYAEMKKYIAKYSDFAETFKKFAFPFDE